MKKCLAILLAMLLAAGCFGALGEGADQEPIEGKIEDGCYILRIPLQEGDPGAWQTDETAGDGPAVRLASLETADGALTLRFEPVNDGTATVLIRHAEGLACDQMFTFDLLVEDGAIRETTGGSYSASLPEEELDPYISGEWVEDQTQFTALTVTKNEGRGWSAVFASPMTHGAYVFRANLFYDCVSEAFIYEDGTLYDLPTDGEIGEPQVSGISGRLVYVSAESGALALSWAAENNPEEREIVFVRVEAAE